MVLLIPSFFLLFKLSVGPPICCCGGDFLKLFIIYVVFFIVSTEMLSTAFMMYSVFYLKFLLLLCLIEFCITILCSDIAVESEAVIL